MKLSVVMSTYNDAATLPASIESVLCQDFRDFEFIIVNDGSPNPRTAEILDDYARRDGRIRVITKVNEGLTKALIEGCAAAQGEYIARIDADDRCLPGRLRQQVECLEGHPEVTLVSCSTRFVTDRGDFLFVTAGDPDPAAATAALRADNVSMLRGVNGHGSTMFRRAVYERCGGYRWQFYFAQDVDLWMRLTDHGLLAFLPEVLYEATFTPAGISGRYAKEQKRLAQIIVSMRLARAAGHPENDLLAEASQIRPSKQRETAWCRQLRLAGGHYFLGETLRRNANARCRHHYLQALAANPCHWRAVLRLVQSTGIAKAHP